MRLKQVLLVGSMAFMLCSSANQVVAQNQGGARPGRGNWDPAQMQQRMMERYKETLEITNEDEWKAIQPLIQKVMELRMASFAGRGGMMRPPRQGGDANQPDDQGPRRGFGPSNPEAETLQKAVDSKASSAELKAALQKYVDSRKQKQADLEKAQADLRKVLTPRQEAIACLSGLL